MDSPIDITSQAKMREALEALENYLKADVFVYFGEIADGVEEIVRKIIEGLKGDGSNNETLYVILTTTGGGLNPVKRMVNIFRHHYKEICFIVPDYAYSAGTVMCCSGDKIYMSYYSVLGPIDPQVINRDGKFVAALGYLDKINELVQKAQDGSLTQAEFIILKDFDLAELRAYEQARDLAIDLLVQWLPKYKFKDWNEGNSSKREITAEMKQERAKEIAANLSDNNKWKSHGRPISANELRELGLYIEVMGEKNQEMYENVMEYHDLMLDYVRKYKYSNFFHSRRFL